MEPLTIEGHDFHPDPEAFLTAWMSDVHNCANCGAAVWTVTKPDGKILRAFHGKIVCPGRMD